MLENVLITNDAIIVGILFLILILIFKATESKNKFAITFFKIIPPILLCYFVPGVLNTFNLFSGKESGIYPFVSKYLLPVCLFLFTLSLDIKILKKFGWKAILVFLSGTVGIIIGGPLAVKIVFILNPQVFEATGEHALWRGLGTIAGSWIGGGANQTALKEILKPSNYVFSQMVAVDVLIAETWLAILLVGVGYSQRLDSWLKADSKMITDMQQKIMISNQENERTPVFNDYLTIFGLGFVVTGIAYFFSDIITPFIKTNYPNLEKFSLTSSFFWVITIITILGIVLSRTSFRKLEHVGASKIGSLLLYLLVAAIGMQMDLLAIADNPWLFLIGILWILVHIVIMTITSKILKVPYFLFAVGSQANIGGAASASVVAGAFHPSLVPIGVIFAVLGYAIGTYGGYLTAMLMKWVLT